MLGIVGNLIVGSDSALGTGLLTLTGGTLQDDGLAARTLSNLVVLLGGTTSTIYALNPSAPLTLTGVVGGAGNLFKGFANLSTYGPSMNGVQTVTFGPGVTGGTFTLTVNGSTTGPITYSGTPATFRGTSRPP